MDTGNGNVKAAPEELVSKMAADEGLPSTSNEEEPAAPVLSEAWRAQTKERWSRLTEDLDETVEDPNSSSRQCGSSEALNLLQSLREAQSQRPLDAPREDLEELLRPIRERVRLRCGQLMWNYDASSRFPRPEDEHHECRDGYELHLLQEGSEDIRKAIVKHFNHGCLNQVWRVVGGSLGDGIIVRVGSELNSEKELTRLGHGSLLEQIRLEGDRLRYKLLEGTGPDSGWISTKLKVKGTLRALAVPVPPHGGLEAGAMASAEPASSVGSGSQDHEGEEAAGRARVAARRGMVVFGLMAAHISSEVRLHRLRNVLKSVRHQNVKREDAQFVFALSWSASSESLASRIREFLDQEGLAFCQVRRPAPAPSPNAEAHRFLAVEQPCRHSQFQHLRAALHVAEASVRGASRCWSHRRPKVDIPNPCEDETRTPSCSSTSSFKSSSPTSSPKVETRRLEADKLSTNIMRSSNDEHGDCLQSRACDADDPGLGNNSTERTCHPHSRLPNGLHGACEEEQEETLADWEKEGQLRDEEADGESKEATTSNGNVPTSSDSNCDDDGDGLGTGGCYLPPTSCWVIFGDDDDIWHPSRVAEYVAALQQLPVPESVGVLATMARVNCRSDRKVTDWELPSSAEDVERFLRSGRGARLDHEEPCKTFRSRLRAAGASLPIPDDLCLEYFDLFPRLRLLHEFFDEAPEALVEHRFCDLAFNEFLCSYPRRGRELGLEVHVFEPRCWMLFYATPIPDTVAWQRSVDGNAKELSDTTPGDATAATIDVNNGHMSSSVDVSPVEVELARRVHGEFVQFDASLSVARLARYWAAFRNTMEVYLMRKVSRKVDQRLFDLYVYLAVNGSFFKFSDVVLRLSQLKVECASRMMYYIGQSYAKVIAKRLDVSVLWHRPNIFLKPPVQEDQHQYPASWSPSYGYAGLAPPAPWLGKHFAYHNGWGPTPPFGFGKGFQKGSKGVGQAFANQAVTKPGKGLSKGVGKSPWAGKGTSPSANSSLTWLR